MTSDSKIFSTSTGSFKNMSSFIRISNLRCFHSHAHNNILGTVAYQYIVTSCVYTKLATLQSIQ